MLSKYARKFFSEKDIWAKKIQIKSVREIVAPLNVVVGEVEVREVRGGGEGGAEGGEAAAGQGQVPETPRLPQQRRERAGAT